ncbi:MAG: TetR/AcrR family transcriptional regulator [Pleurocapsa minor GSE-CHR-MK-17-07R]|jgi:AcrR family transcriptional regulator|nr:TetR/AcrR family transcriptional regulator [Pleurocapsa minor GSE-CHR-MK 17-07R]
MNDFVIFQDARPTRSDAVKNREQILRTAQELIHERGVESVTMSAVAEAAGVGKGTLYRHFPGKPQLLEELIDADQRDLQNRTLYYLRTHPGTPMENLHWFVTEVIAFVERNMGLLSTITVIQTDAGVDHPAHYWWRQTIRGLLTQAGIAQHLDIEYVTDLIYVMLDPRVMTYMGRTRGYDIERQRDAVLGVVDTLLAR